MFLSELKLSLDFLARELKRSALGIAPKSRAYVEEYEGNLRAGIQYYSRWQAQLESGMRALLIERLAVA